MFVLFLTCITPKLYKNIFKTGQNGHFGRHLGFWKMPPGDFRGLFISDSTHVPAPILKKISLLPKMSTYLAIWANTTGLITFASVSKKIHSPGIEFSGTLCTVAHAFQNHVLWVSTGSIFYCWLLCFVLMLRKRSGGKAQIVNLTTESSKTLRYTGCTCIHLLSSFVKEEPFSGKVFFFFFFFFKIVWRFLFLCRLHGTLVRDTSLYSTMQPDKIRQYYVHKITVELYP